MSWWFSTRARAIVPHAHTRAHARAHTHTRKQRQRDVHFQTAFSAKLIKLALPSYSRKRWAYTSQDPLRRSSSCALRLARSKVMITRQTRYNERALSFTFRLLPCEWCPNLWSSTMAVEGKVLHAVLSTMAFPFLSPFSDNSCSYHVDRSCTVWMAQPRHSRVNYESLWLGDVAASALSASRTLSWSSSTITLYNLSDRPLSIHCRGHTHTHTPHKDLRAAAFCIKIVTICACALWLETTLVNRSATEEPPVLLHYHLRCAVPSVFSLGNRSPAVLRLIYRGLFSVRII